MELVTVDNLKKFMYVEHNEDDSLIEMMAESAESYIKNHLSITGSMSLTGSLDTNAQNACRIATYQLVSHFYENRNIAMSGGEMENAGIKLIEHLRVI